MCESCISVHEVSVWWAWKVCSVFVRVCFACTCLTTSLHPKNFVDRSSVSPQKYTSLSSEPVSKEEKENNKKRTSQSTSKAADSQSVSQSACLSIRGHVPPQRFCVDLVSVQTVSINTWGVHVSSSQVQQQTQCLSVQSAAAAAETRAELTHSAAWWPSRPNVDYRLSISRGEGGEKELYEQG